MSSLKEQVQSVLPPPFNIMNVAAVNDQGDRIIPEENQNNIDIQVPAGVFPDDKIWITQMYISVTGSDVSLTIWFSVDMEKTAEALVNLHDLKNTVGDSLSDIGLEEVEVKDRPSVFAWHGTFTQEDFFGVLTSIFV